MACAPLLPPKPNRVNNLLPDTLLVIVGEDFRVGARVIGDRFKTSIRSVVSNINEVLGGGGAIIDEFVLHRAQEGILGMVEDAGKAAAVADGFFVEEEARMTWLWYTGSPKAPAVGAYHYGRKVKTRHAPRTTGGAAHDSLWDQIGL